jgi:hypothetical protein
MNEIVTQIADRVGIAPDLAEKALGMMLGFLQREAADGPVAKMIEAIPGGADLVAQFNGAGAGGGGLLGGLMSSLGGGGIMGLGQQLMGEGNMLARKSSTRSSLPSRASASSSETRDQEPRILRGSLFSLRKHRSEEHPRSLGWKESP